MSSQKSINLNLEQYPLANSNKNEFFLKKQDEKLIKKILENKKNNQISLNNLSFCLRNFLKNNYLIENNFINSIKKRKLKHPISRKCIKFNLLFSKRLTHKNQKHIINKLFLINLINNSFSQWPQHELSKIFKVIQTVNCTKKNPLRRSNMSEKDFSIWLNSVEDSVKKDFNIFEDKKKIVKVDCEPTEMGLKKILDESLFKRLKKKNFLNSFKSKNELRTEDLIQKISSSNIFENNMSSNLENNFINDTNQSENLKNIMNDLTFQLGESTKTECEICFEVKDLNKRICCNYSACGHCLSQYFQAKVSMGIFSIECINDNCNSLVNRNEISVSLDSKYKDIYHNLLRSNNDLGKLTRTCPNCNQLYKLKDNSFLKKMRKNQKKESTLSRVKCQECDTYWCFLCHAPWHNDISCKQYMAGDRLFREWTKQFHSGQLNAQRCPTCKTYIQRESGCDHMHCTNCLTNFCYKCGEKLRRFKFFGNHYSKLSIFGCKYKYKANQPALRKTVRFTVLCAKLAAAPAIGSASLAALTFLVALGLAALPIYGLVKVARWTIEKNNKNKIKDSVFFKNSLKNKINSNLIDFNKNSNGFEHHFIHYNPNESPLHTVTFTQNANWLANYSLVPELSSTSALKETPFSTFNNLSDFGYSDPSFYPTSIYNKKK